MKTLSPEAIDLLQKMLALEVVEQVKDGKGEEPMPEHWLELYALTIGL